MPNIINSSGLQTATQAELIAAFTTAFQTIYGADIDLSSDTPDGQMMMIFIQTVLDELDLITQVYNGMDPDNAIGVTLDQRVALNGIQRQAGTFTIQNVSIIVTVPAAGSVIFKGLDLYPNDPYIVADNAGNQYELIATATFAVPGTTTEVLSFQAAKPGNVQSGIGTITVPVTIVLGAGTINNPTTYSILGVTEESDAALKVRRQKSVALSSKGYLQGLLASLENIPGILSAFVHENFADTTDANGVDPHSIWAIVQGVPSPQTFQAWDSVTTYGYGALVNSGGVSYISWLKVNLANDPASTPTAWGVYSPIAEAIYSKRNAGCGMKGASTYPITQINGVPITIQWDVVTQPTLYISFIATSIDGIHSPNTAAIYAQLPTLFAPGVADRVNFNDLATIVQQIDPNTLVTGAAPNYGFSLTGAAGTFVPVLSPLSLSEQFRATVGSIVIT